MMILLHLRGEGKRRPLIRLVTSGSPPSPTRRKIDAMRLLLSSSPGLRRDLRSECWIGRLKTYILIES
jgi:hypothetical protein